MIPIGASFSGPLTVIGVLLIGASVLMAIAFFSAQNNLQRQSGFGNRIYRDPDYGYNYPKYGYNNNIDVDATAANVVPQIESSNSRYQNP